METLSDRIENLHKAAEAILKACEYDPKKRWDSPTEFGKVLESLLKDYTSDPEKNIIVNEYIFSGKSAEPVIKEKSKTGTEGFGTVSAVSASRRDNSSTNIQRRDISNMFAEDETVGIAVKLPENQRPDPDETVGIFSTSLPKSINNRTAEQAETPKKPRSKASKIISIVLIILSCGWFIFEALIKVYFAIGLIVVYLALIIIRKKAGEKILDSLDTTLKILILLISIFGFNIPGMFSAFV